MGKSRIDPKPRRIKAKGNEWKLTWKGRKALQSSNFFFCPKERPDHMRCVCKQRDSHFKVRWFS
ncbi:uncharacterized protein J3R85_003295 [Psidium guajava]|nr:uncharacterized protein J3R85_003295 [Psidium guajava]